MTDAEKAAMIKRVARAIWHATPGAEDWDTLDEDDEHWALCLVEAEVAVDEMGFFSPAQDGWQDIETAPRDGTAILVMRNIWPGASGGVAEECSGHNTYVAAWWTNEVTTGGQWICYMDAVQDPRCPVDPTHWRPLPAPPSTEREGE